VESANSEKVCKTASFFAAYPEMELPEEQTGAVKGPDWRIKDEDLPGRGDMTIAGTEGTEQRELNGRGGACCDRLTKR